MLLWFAPSFSWNKNLAPPFALCSAAFLKQVCPTYYYHVNHHTLTDSLQQQNWDPHIVEESLLRSREREVVAHKSITGSWWLVLATLIPDAKMVTATTSFPLNHESGKQVCRQSSACFLMCHFNGVPYCTALCTCVVF